MDLLGSLALKVAQIDGRVDETERAAIHDYFVTEWGYDPGYTSKALMVIEEGGTKARLQDMTANFASFAKSNPDCNFDAMRRELVSFLQEIAEADGVLNEREELAIEKIDRMVCDETSLQTTVSAVVAIPTAATGWVGSMLDRAIWKTKETPVSE